MSEKDICAICYETLDNESCYKLECGHSYHNKCIINWFRTGKNNCPLCNSNKLDIDNMNYFTKIEMLEEIIKFTTIYNYCC